MNEKTTQIFVELMSSNERRELLTIINYEKYRQLPSKYPFNKKQNKLKKTLHKTSKL